ncbi:MAG: hypothetical protein IT379_39005 [Deltaproteobacteria bacterium]|nr:hypothetical protein [Deltaproteobacteria bacterium]
MNRSSTFIALVLSVFASLSSVAMAQELPASDERMTAVADEASPRPGAREAARRASFVVIAGVVVTRLSGGAIMQSNVGWVVVHFRAGVTAPEAGSRIAVRGVAVAGSREIHNATILGR